MTNIFSFVCSFRQNKWLVHPLGICCSHGKSGSAHIPHLNIHSVSTRTLAPSHPPTYSLLTLHPPPLSPCISLTLHSPHDSTHHRTLQLPLWRHSRGFPRGRSDNLINSSRPRNTAHCPTLYLKINKIITKQESIPVGCIPPACRPYVLRWSPDVSTCGGGHQVNKFEQVSSDVMDGFPYRSHFFYFHTVFDKEFLNNCLAPSEVEILDLPLGYELLKGSIL